MKTLKMGWPRKRGILCLGLCVSVALGTQVGEYTTSGEGGVQTFSYYSNGQSFFGWKCPDTWVINLNPGKNIAITAVSPNNDSAVISIAQEPVEETETRLKASHKATIRSALTENREFTIEKEEDMPLDFSKGWQVSGTEVIVNKDSKGKEIKSEYFEKHSYYIKQGYLHHVWIRVPRELWPRYEKTFREAYRKYYVIDPENAGIVEAERASLH